MQCTACGSDNPDSHRFCGQCGAALVRACPACSFANEPGGKFCGGCGAPLDGQDPPASHAAPDDATPVSGGERRQVSVLFADLSGFTRLSSGLDPEETHALLNRFFAAVDAVVERYGGAVDKHVGDSVMAVFGAPVAHGNDPERAVRAAIDIHQAVAGLTRDNGEALSVHIGVASGQVVASGTGSAAHQEYTVTGDSVNLASRLQDLAAAGQTLISDAVRNAVSADVECEDIGEVEVAGLPKAVRVWRLIGWAGPRTAGKVPLIGRKFELGQFGNALSACAQNGTGQTLYLRGEAGIGKTRLIEDFRTIAQTSGHTCHSVLVLDFGAGRSGDAVRALVRSLLDVPSSGEGAKSRADWAVSSGLVDTERALFLYDLLNLAQPPELSALYQAMDNSARRRGFEEAVAGLVSGLAARGPLLITVEDIQWADSIVLEQLAALAAAVAGCRAVLVLTSRIDGDPLDQAWRAATGGSPLLTFDLAPLRHEEALELAGGYFQASEAFARRCIERAEGNPLFLDQLLRSAEEAGEDDIPGSVQSLVLSRMDRLEAADRQALQAAAVLGPQFSLDALRHILADRAYICRNLIEHILVRPAGDDFLFAHALIRDGAYSSLLKARRRELHGRAAQWFDGRDPVLRAEHLDGAHDAAAPAAYLEAARVHAAQYHFERALHVAERGLALSETADDEYALAILMGEVLHDLGEIAASTEAFESALAVASDNERRCNAWIGLAGGLRIADRF